MVLQSENNFDSARMITPARQDEDEVEEDPRDFCYICGMEFEDHALDYNIDLFFHNNLLQECFLNQEIDGGEPIGALSHHYETAKLEESKV